MEGLVVLLVFVILLQALALMLALGLLPFVLQQVWAVKSQVEKQRTDIDKLDEVVDEIISAWRGGTGK